MYTLINIIRSKSFYTPISQSKNFLNPQRRKNLLLFMLYIIGAIFYSLSLCHLNESKMKCFNQIGAQCYYVLCILGFIASCFTVISIYIIIIFNFNKLHLSIITFIYFLFYLIDHNFGVEKHGLLNFLGFIFISLVLFLLVLYIHMIYFFIKKRRYISVIILIFPFLLIYVFFKIYKATHFSCVGWEKGLNDTSIDNSSKDYPCNIEIPSPHRCYLGELGPYANFILLLKQNCQDPNLLKQEKQKFLNDMKNLKYFEKSKKNHFGYPLTNKGDFNANDYGTITDPGKKSFEKDVNEKVILMDLYNENKDLYYPNISKPEIEVIFNDDGGKIIFNIEKNESLIEERKKLINNNSIYKNVLVIFIDTLSRPHFYRKFPKTYKFLNQFSKYEENFDKKNITVFEYFKYHSLVPWTEPNLKAAYYGTKIEGNGVHFCKYFKENGYILGRINAFCEKETVFNDKNTSFFDHGEWDHEGLSLACMKTFYDNFFNLRLTSILRKCSFGKDINEHSIEYLKKFWLTYLSENKLFLFQTLDGHEPTGEVLGYFDNTLFEFLNDFYSKGYFEDTAILIFSDHGQHLNGPFYLLDSQDFNIERALPTLFLILPNNNILYKNNNYEKIKFNQQTLITSFDIYNTLIHIVFGENSEITKTKSCSFGKSLLTEIDYKQRFCTSPMFENQILECKCDKKI